MNIAFAHGAGHPDAAAGPVSLLTDWTLDPVFLLPLLLACLYFRGFAAYRRKGGRRLPPWRAFCFTGGLAVLALALLSPIDALAERSFIFHMAQHDLLMLAGVPLLLLGAPFIPAVRGLPPAVRRRVFIPMARHPAVRAVVLWLTRPLVALVLFECTIVFWHFPAFYDAALFNETVHYAMHLSFALTGVLFWWHIVTPFPFPSRLHTFQRIGMIFASAVVNGTLSAMIVFSDAVLYGYDLLPDFWGLTMKDDQTIGAGLMWVMGDMFRLLAILALFAVYAAQETAKEPHARRSGSSPVGEAPRAGGRFEAFRQEGGDALPGTLYSAAQPASRR
jgi:cytochrome c oxidase assembly factor CtaG